jgi:crossover junction endodeoxyribonuclease RuvC
MIILGIDPGIAIVGYGVINYDGGISAVDYGVINTPKEENTPVRLHMIADEMNALIAKHKPNAIAVEELFFAKNIKTALNVAQARGVILYCAIKECGNLFEYTPLQIKQALTGYGRADKNQIQQMVRVLLSLKSVPKPDDAADALAAAITHSRFAGAANKNFI